MASKPAAFAVIPCAGTETTSFAVAVPKIVALRLMPLGQPCVPLGGLTVSDGLPQSQMTMAPFTAGWPKWMCACVTSAPRPAYESSQSNELGSFESLILNVAFPSVFLDGTSFEPVRCCE